MSKTNLYIKLTIFSVTTLLWSSVILPNAPSLSQSGVARTAADPSPLRWQVYLPLIQQGRYITLVASVVGQLAAVERTDRRTYTAANASDRRQ